MKSATTFKTKSLKSSLSAVALAATLCFHSGAAFAQVGVPTTDYAVWVQNAALYAETLIVKAEAIKTAVSTEATRVLQEWGKLKEELRVEDLKKAYADLSGLQNKITSEIENARIARAAEPGRVKYDLNIINSLHQSTKKTLSPEAQAYFPNPNTCKVAKPEYKALVGTAFAVMVPTLLAGATLEDKIEYNCVAQRELKAISIQVTKDHNAYLKSNHEKNINEALAMKASGTDGNSIAAANLALESVRALADFDDKKFNGYKQALNYQEQILAIIHRDLEVEKMQGNKNASPTMVSDLVKSAAITSAILGTTGSRAVDGNRRTTIDAAKYAN